MTLLARDEIDIVDSWLAFHLNAGADMVIATDNRSQDGTTEVLEEYARSGHVHLLHEPGEDLRQNEWVTRMARLAATKFGADWVINSDADEFWWPRGASLSEVLEAELEREIGHRLIGFDLQPVALGKERSRFSDQRKRGVARVCDVVVSLHSASLAMFPSVIMLALSTPRSRNSRRCSSVASAPGLTRVVSSWPSASIEFSVEC